LFCLALTKFRFGDVSEQSVTGSDVTFFVLAVFFSGVLDGIIGQLHHDLVFTCDFRIVFLIFFGTGSHITFFEAIKLTVV